MISLEARARAPASPETLALPLNERIALIQEAALIFGMEAARQLMEKLEVPQRYAKLIEPGSETIH